MSYQPSDESTNFLKYLSNVDFLGEQNDRRNVAIVATIGPSCRNVPMICQFLRAGMNVARINMSYETNKEHILSIKYIREAVEIVSKEWGSQCFCGIAADLKGREIRIGQFCPRKYVDLSCGDTVKLTVNENLATRSTKDVVYIDYAGIIKSADIGQHIFIDDSAVIVEVQEIGVDLLVCRVLNNGRIKSGANVVIPRLSLDLPVVSEVDAEHIEFCIDNDCDFFFLSKLRSAEDVRKIRALLTVRGKNIKLITKIENIEALQNIDDIIQVSDGIFYARTDLSMELNVGRIFMAQKAVIARCNLLGKPVICGTQLLYSMIDSPIPKRTDIVDIGNTVLDGADCLLLSSETAVGYYPVETIKTLAKACRDAEPAIWHLRLFKDLTDDRTTFFDVAHAVAISAVMTSMAISARGIFVVTVSGRSAELVSMYRPRCPVFALVCNPRVGRQDVIYRSLVPVLVPADEYGDGHHCPRDLEKRVKYGLNIASLKGLVKHNDPIVIVSPTQNKSGYVNNVVVAYANLEKNGSDSPLSFIENKFITK